MDGVGRLGCCSSGWGAWRGWSGAKKEVGKEKATKRGGSKSQAQMERNPPSLRCRFSVKWRDISGGMKMTTATPYDFGHRWANPQRKHEQTTV